MDVIIKNCRPKLKLPVRTTISIFVFYLLDYREA